MVKQDSMFVLFEDRITRATGQFYTSVEDMYHAQSLRNEISTIVDSFLENFDSERERRFYKELTFKYTTPGIIDVDYMATLQELDCCLILTIDSLYGVGVNIDLANMALNQGRVSIGLPKRKIN